MRRGTMELQGFADWLQHVRERTDEVGHKSEGRTIYNPHMTDPLYFRMHIILFLNAAIILGYL